MTDSPGDRRAQSPGDGRAERPGDRRAHRPGERPGPRLENEGRAWRIRSWQAARQLLRAREETAQAGFTAEAIPRSFLRHHPILLSDGPGHDEQRRLVGRFFAPSVVDADVTPVMHTHADALIAEAVARGEVLLEDLALHYAVAVTRKVVGLTHAPLEKMSARLVRFLRQPPFDLTKPRWGRTNRQWAAAAWNGLLPVIAFHLRDVRPAVRERRADPRDDVISHLIALGCSDSDILVECMTYATAGMITTREFIAMACWHLLEDRELRDRFRRGERAERFAILHEIIRLEPVVGHLFRRVTSPITVTDRDSEARPEEGDLADLCIRETNTDPDVMGEQPHALCPGRPLPKGVAATGLSFGAGAHRCPGEHLAIAETEVLLTRLLEHDPELVAVPRIDWEELVAGYRLRGMRLRFPSRERADA